MPLRIAGIFTGSLARLTGDEQQAVKTMAFDLLLNPAQPGMSPHNRAGRTRQRSIAPDGEVVSGQGAGRRWPSVRLRACAQPDGAAVGVL